MSDGPSGFLSPYRVLDVTNHRGLLAGHMLAQLGVKQANVVVDDKGALECVLRARVQAAALRAAQQSQLQWSQL